jgi:cobalamin biosynthesis Mg chelatase CobN
VGQVPEEAGHEVDANAMTLVASCLNVLAAKAWEALGLVPSPATKQVERNLDEAQLAIDAAAALANVVRPRVADAERREIENLIATLRLNFVEQKNKAP